ncbi:hypothetical protein DESUT3_16990 [Desulfuromonas versatilis]|uniref:PsbP C-terminal domain-containing protein n=1 Tax=Desulfuromonas versatilis TaxID=2802975 RepID=A0ABN6DX70_9BACT|nr:PsbP-related protein [Desulfuromonas versatilis]BCR04630.1 hypothetical protein DESUT3_16990 [Desulfuromonas versatilis]
MARFAKPEFSIPAFCGYRLPRIAMRLIAAAGIVLALSCCSGPGQITGGDKRIQETYYYDANLEFALEHPRKWTRTRVAAEGYPQVPYAIRLGPPARKDEAGQIRVTITSIPPTLARGGYAALQANYLQASPGFVLESEAAVPLTYTPAWQVTGQNAERTALVYLITSNRRAYIIELSAPTAAFDKYRPVFEALAQSFLPLD